MRRPTGIEGSERGVGRGGAAWQASGRRGGGRGAVNGGWRRRGRSAGLRPGAALWPLACSCSRSNEVGSPAWASPGASQRATMAGRSPLELHRAANDRATAAIELTTAIEARR